MKTQIDICICTFRRPHIVETLGSVARIERDPNWDIRLIVVDNDDTPAAREMIEAAAEELHLSMTYLHVPGRNIAIARNACLDAATAPLMSFIDDDERVAPRWLTELMTTLQSSAADAVFGPVQGVYGPGCPDWMRQEEFHSSMPVWSGDEIATGGCGNVLMWRTAPAFAGLRFRTDLGKTGGEDTAFFSALHKAGGRMAYAQEALVTEDVPPERASLSWLIKRRFRYGQTHAMLLLEAGKGSMISRLKAFVPAAAKAFFCFGMAMLNIFRGCRMRFWILRGVLHIGVISRLLGCREDVSYG
jgi:succinoglycan biosynthesis protein ExoM